MSRESHLTVDMGKEGDGEMVGKKGLVFRFRLAVNKREEPDGRKHSISAVEMHLGATESRKPSLKEGESNLEISPPCGLAAKK